MCDGPFGPTVNNLSGCPQNPRNIETAEWDGSTMFYLYLWTIVVPIIFSLIILIGTVGNSLVIYVIFSRRKMRTVTNILLLNLAISDISFLVICVPFQAYKYAAFSWPYGNLSCKLVQYFLYVTAYVTVWTLTAIAWTRFLIVVCSNQTARFRTRKNAVCLCAIIWMIMLAVNIPIIKYHRINTFDVYTYCGIEKKHTWSIFMSFFVCAYAIPLTLICCLYMLIVIHLRINQGTTLNKSSRERTARACKVIVIVVVVFGVSWAPLHINSILSYFNKLPTPAFYEVFRIIWHCMAYGNSLANPFIYNYASEEFKKAFKEIFCCKYQDKREQLTTQKRSDSGNPETQSMIRNNNQKSHHIVTENTYIK